MSDDDQCPACMWMHGYHASDCAAQYEAEIAALTAERDAARKGIADIAEALNNVADVLGLETGQDTAAHVCKAMFGIIAAGEKAEAEAECARLRGLVEKAYREGAGQNRDDIFGTAAEEGWLASDTKRALAGGT